MADLNNFIAFAGAGQGNKAAKEVSQALYDRAAEKVDALRQDVRMNTFQPADVEQFEEPSEQEVLDQLDQVEAEESEEIDQVEEDNEPVEEDQPEEEHGEDISTDNSGS